MHDFNAFHDVSFVKKLWNLCFFHIVFRLILHFCSFLSGVAGSSVPSVSLSLAVRIIAVELSAGVSDKELATG